MGMRRLSGMDAMLLYSETPNVHTHTIKVGVLDVSHFDGAFTVELLRTLLARRLHLLEPLRYQLVEVPLRLHHPAWLENAAVDLDYHVRRVTLPSPGGRRELDELIGEVTSTPLDRSRPMWEMYLVEGMADGCVAVIMKVHHALADGIASANLLARMMAFTATAEEEREPSAPAAPPTRRQLLAAAGRDILKQYANLPRLVAATIMGIWRLWRREKEREPVPQLAGRFSSGPTFINHTLTAGRQFASATLPLDDIKQTSKRLGIKINSLVLAIAAGALRELLLRYDGRADRPLIASVPASLDPDPNRVTGNEVGALNVSLPVQVGDPMERVRLSSLGSSIAKEDIDLLGPRLIWSWMEYLPSMIAPPAFRWMSRRTFQTMLQNLTVSNVPGPRERGHPGGAMIREFYSVGPLLSGSALNITVWSYVDQLNFSVLSDDRTFHDPHEVTDALMHSFAEIRGIAGLPEEIVEVDTAMGSAEAIA